jgi:hypothetical protein
MAISVLTPFPVITDIDGAPLDDGYIWVGVDGLDPAANPQAAFWDAALTQPATQPVRTRGGYALNGSNRARIFTANNYSIRVDNANGSTVYQSLSENGLYGGNSTASGVDYNPPVTGGVTRSVNARLSDIITIKDFGAVGDGVTNDTAAFTAAVAYIENSPGYSVFVPPGVYLTDPFQIGPLAFNAQGFFWGEEAASTVIRRRGTGAGAFITIGDPLATVFQANYAARGLTIDGGPNTNGPALVSYDLVRSTFEEMIFKGGSYAYASYGGIANSFYHCKFQDATRALFVDGFAPPGGLSPAGGGWPNILRFTDCHMVDCTEWGVWFDKGRMLILDKCQIEGNGTTLAAAQGGVYVGTGIGDEVESTDPESLGIIMSGCWLEANKGIADIHLNSGLNAVRDCNFFSQSTAVTNDIRIDGGRYRFDNLNMSFGKTANVLENSGAGVGNVMRFVQAAALSYNSSKTTVETGVATFLGNGAVPGINGATAPLIQVGSDATSANPTISFPQAFKAATTPKVYVTVVNNSASTMETPEVYNESNINFTVRKKSFNGTTISTANYTVNWIAIGENP